jgi:hypothetical protein
MAYGIEAERARNKVAPRSARLAGLALAFIGKGEARD